MSIVKPFLGALLLACAATAFAQQNFDKVEIKAIKLNDSTYMLMGAGGNIGVSVGADAVFMIDDQYAPLTPKIEAAVKAITDKPVKFVFNTHWHGDHTGGNANMGKSGAIIVAHDNVLKRMSSEQFNDLFKSKTAPSPKEALPVVTFAQEVTFHLNGDDIVAMHVPRAHTDGDAILWFKKGNIVHMGDCFFNGLYPFIDASSGGSPEGTVEAVDKILAMVNEQTKIIPGHGPLSDKAGLKAFRDMLATVTGRVKEMKNAGKKLEDVVAAKPTADFDEKWGKGFLAPAKFVEMIYNGVGK